jgi:hypothetical protein
VNQQALELGQQGQLLGQLPADRAADDDMRVGEGGRDVREPLPGIRGSLDKAAHAGCQHQYVAVCNSPLAPMQPFAQAHEPGGRTEMRPK